MSDEQQKLEKEERLRLARELEPELEARRKRDRERKRKSRERQKETTQQATEVEKKSTDTEELSEKAAKQVIADEWGITRSHLIDTVYTWGKQAAEQLKIAKTAFYWSNGPVATLGSLKANEAQPLLKIEGNNIVVGEVTYKREIFALYHFVEAWRTDAILTFEEYLTERRSCKTDGTINRGNKYFGKDFHEQPHQRWDDMFIRWNPDSLKPDYTQEDAKKWLDAQSPDKKRLLIACRNSYKSNFSLVYLVGAVLCNPDIRLLFVSETRPLSKSFLAGFRQFFEISNPNEPRRFVRLFPEYCVPVGDGSSLEFLSPMRILGLFQPTAHSTSMESGGWAGSRSDYTLFSDSISSNTVGTEDQIQKSVTNTDAILELTEVGGFVHWEGTPWRENDLYAQILERNERSVEKSLIYIIDPAWTVKEHAKGKGLFELTEDDVDLLFPARLTWKFLQQKLRDGDPKGRTFRMQSLCQFLPDVEADQKLQFSKEELQRHVVQFPDVPTIDDQVYASGDLGFSQSRYADPSCFTVFKIAGSKLYVLWQDALHGRDSEKSEKIVELQKRFPHIKRWAIEKYPSCERLDETVRSVAAKYGITAPSIYWWQAPNTKDRKFHYLKSLESYISQGRIKFQSGTWNDDLFNELEKLDGTTAKRRSSTRHDDRGDSLSIGVTLFMPSDEEPSAERQKYEEEEASRIKLLEQYEMYFGSGVHKSVTTGRAWHHGASPTPEAPVNDDYNPIYSALKPLQSRVPNRVVPSPPTNQRTVSFADIRKKNN